MDMTLNQFRFSAHELHFFNRNFNYLHLVITY